MVTNNPMRHVLPIGRHSRIPGRRRLVFSIALAGLLAGFTMSCSTPEPKSLLRVSDVETYWVLDPSRTEKRFLAPAVRFRVENVSSGTLVSIDATAAFLREGTDEPWGSGYFQVTEGRKRLAPGAKALVTMSSDARYSLDGEPEAAFANPNFKSVHTKYFLRVGSSAWVEFGRTKIDNVIGSKAARAVLEHN